MAGDGVTGQVRTAAARVPAPVLVLVAIASVQTGSAFARTAFDVTGAAGITLLRLAISGLLLVAILRPPVRRWSRAQWMAAAAARPDHGRDEPDVLRGASARSRSGSP